MVIHKTFKVSSKFRNLDVEDLTVLPRCHCAVLTARNRATGRNELYLIFSGRKRNCKN